MPRLRSRLDTAERLCAAPARPPRPTVTVSPADRRRCLLELRTHARTDAVREKIDVALAALTDA
jgi:hypothetical protein